CNKSKPKCKKPKTICKKPKPKPKSGCGCKKPKPKPKCGKHTPKSKDLCSGIRSSGKCWNIKSALILLVNEDDKVFKYRYFSKNVKYSLFVSFINSEWVITIDGT